jgi:hypothetical protein
MKARCWSSRTSRNQPGDRGLGFRAGQTLKGLCLPAGAGGGPDAQPGPVVVLPHGGVPAVQAVLQVRPGARAGVCACVRGAHAYSGYVPPGKLRTSPYGWERPRTVARTHVCAGLWRTRWPPCSRSRSRCASRAARSRRWRRSAWRPACCARTRARVTWRWRASACCRCCRCGPGSLCNKPRGAGGRGTTPSSRTLVEAWCRRGIPCGIDGLRLAWPPTIHEPRPLQCQFAGPQWCGWVGGPKNHFVAFSWLPSWCSPRGRRPPGHPATRPPGPTTRPTTPP